MDGMLGCNERALDNSSVRCCLLCRESSLGRSWRLRRSHTQRDHPPQLETQTRESKKASANLCIGSWQNCRCRGDVTHCSGSHCQNYLPPLWSGCCVLTECQFHCPVLVAIIRDLALSTHNRLMVLLLCHRHDFWFPQMAAANLWQVPCHCLTKPVQSDWGHSISVRQQGRQSIESFADVLLLLL